MSRTKLTLLMAGAAVAAGAAGCALGVLFAPASGKETRLRLTWRAEEGWRSAKKASERFVERAAALAKEELAKRGMYEKAAA